MGSAEFYNYQPGTDPQAAFDEAVADSQLEYGHNSYSGKIGAKGFDGFEVLVPATAPVTWTEAKTIAEGRMFNDADPESEPDKHGPALAIAVRGWQREVCVEFAREPGKSWANAEEAWDCHVVLPEGVTRVSRCTGMCETTDPPRGPRAWHVQPSPVRVVSGKLYATVTGGDELTGWYFFGRAPS